MSRTIKALILGGILCVLGLIIGFIGYHFNGYRTDNIITYEAPEEDPLILTRYDVKNIDDLIFVSISTKRMPVTIKAHDFKYIAIEYYKNESQTFIISESDGKISMKKEDLGFFDEYVTSNLLSFISKQEKKGITLYIPSTYKGELIVNTSFGDITIQDTLAFSRIRKIDFKNTFADIKLSSLSGDILNLKISRGNIECSDVRFKNITLLVANADMHIDYIKSDSLDVFSDKSNIIALNILSDNIFIDAKSSDTSFSMLAYADQFSVKVDKSIKSVVNIEENIIDTTLKTLEIKAIDSAVTITFSLDK